MRKIIVLSMVSLDGVMQAPGGPDEDTSRGFKYGGWVAPHSDETSEKVFKKLMEPADLLLGRNTFEIWENYWPEHAEIWPKINEVNKFVLSTTRNHTIWENCVFLENVEEIKNLKNTEGPEIKVWGSSELVQLLLMDDLVDEFWLMTYPVLLGNGKKIFDGNASPAAFTLVESTITPNGVIIANYIRIGEVKTGSIGE